MKVHIERTNVTEEVALSDAQSVEALLSFLKINADEVLVMKDGVLVTDDELLEEGNTIKLLSVVSGG